MKKLLISAAIAASAGLAQADYQFELGAFAGQADGEGVDVDVFGIGGDMYFDKVDTRKGPLAEASFLDRASGVNFSYLNAEPDGNADDIDSFGLGGRVVTNSNLILELDYTETDSGSSDSDALRFGVGTYVAENTDIVVSVGQESADGGPDIDSLNADLHGVAPLQRGAYIGYDANLSYLDADDDNGFSIGGGATYYPTRMLGVGLSANITEVGDIDSDTVSLDLSFFPAEQIELVASWYDQSGDIESDGILLGAAMRF